MKITKSLNEILAKIFRFLTNPIMEEFSEYKIMMILDFVIENRLKASEVLEKVSRSEFDRLYVNARTKKTFAKISIYI